MRLTVGIGCELVFECVYIYICVCVCVYVCELLVIIRVWVHLIAPVLNRIVIFA